MTYAVTTERSIAMVLLAIVVVGWAIYVFVNIRRSKSEVGSEIELAASVELCRTTRPWKETVWNESKLSACSCS